MGLKAVANVSAGGTITGSGTAGKLAKFTSATALGDSLLSESGTTITSAATAEVFGNAQTWTVPSNAFAITVGVAAAPPYALALDSNNRFLGVGTATGPGTILHASDGGGPFAGSTYEGVRLQRATEALFSASDYTRSFRAGLTGSTAVVGTSTAHDLLLQRNNVTALTLGASGAVTFAGNLTSSAAQTWTLAASTSALNIASNLLNLNTTNSRVGIGTASPTDKLVVTGGGVAINGNITGATTSANTLLMDSVSSQARFFSIGSSVSTFGNYVFQALKSGGSPGAVTVCTLDQAGGVILGSTATAVFSAGSSGQGIKLPAAPGNADVQTLDCYQENTVTDTGVVLTGFTVSAGVVTTRVAWTRIGRGMALSLLIKPNTLGASLTMSASSTINLAAVSGFPTLTFDTALACAAGNTSAVNMSCVFLHTTDKIVYCGTQTNGPTPLLYIVISGFVVG